MKPYGNTTGNQGSGGSYPNQFGSVGKYNGSQGGSSGAGSTTGAATNQYFPGSHNNSNGINNATNNNANSNSAANSNNLKPVYGSGGYNNSANAGEQ